MGPRSSFMYIKAHNRTGLEKLVIRANKVLSSACENNVLSGAKVSSSANRNMWFPSSIFDSPVTRERRDAVASRM